MRLTSIFATALAVIGITAASAAETPVTFTKDVAPILEARCQICHRAGQIAPMSLMTYQEARPWARLVALTIPWETVGLSTP